VDEFVIDNDVIIITSVARAAAKYCDEFVCLCVCLSDRISPEHHAQPLPNFYACRLLPWLGPPPAH